MPEDLVLYMWVLGVLTVVFTVLFLISKFWKR